MDSTNSTDSWAAASNALSTQWIEPSDVFSVLLILGGDVIQLALASLTGGPLLTPIAFSFGWVAYAISAVLSAVGENRLVRCAPEVDVQVFNLQSGYRRSNRSWLLGRLIQTYPFWIAPEVKAEVDGAEARVALCITVYKWRDSIKPGVPAHDLIWWSGFGISAMQLGIAAIPFGLYHDWTIFLVTACGTILCYASASLPHWRIEKWHARTTEKDVALTLGNGSQHVVIILGAKHGLDLEDLAVGRAPDVWSTRFATIFLAILWLVLLITCTGIKTKTWYLLVVGGLGMLHNIVVAGAPRRPAALGLPIEPVTMEGHGVEVYAEPKVMYTLMELELKHKGFGKPLLEEFFPGKLRDWEVKWWESESQELRMQMLKQDKENRRLKMLKEKEKEKEKDKEKEKHLLMPTIVVV
ncbi:hypothetical protein DL764_002718 [Monosporascus ibericus]|uniref:Uncharacterized protein n=1 Tax=Monosporascus ibericus TaxID=155417 RepID=A0A4Q4TP30_9PEZI|nr:hypothetical protein DL764_002718 [Monosporascus ibericus]